MRRQRRLDAQRQHGRLLQVGQLGQLGRVRRAGRPGLPKRFLQLAGVGPGGEQPEQAKRPGRATGPHRTAGNRPGRHDSYIYTVDTSFFAGTGLSPSSRPLVSAAASTAITVISAVAAT